MKTVFVIGGMGSGKSTVANAFADLGAPVLDLDNVGHDVLHIDEAKKKLVEAFGFDILDDSGEVVRSALATKAFASSEATARLSGITQVFIMQSLREWLATREAEGCDLAFVEVSAYGGPQGEYADIADCIVAVVAPVELRVERAVAKGFNEADVRQRIERQPSDSDRAVWADYVVENDGSPEDLRREIANTWLQLSAS